MIRSRVFAVLLLAGAALGGCPLSGDDQGRSVVGGQNFLGPTASSSHVSDDLTDSFPGCTEPDNVEALRDELFRLVNQARVEAGLLPVAYDFTLEAQASEYACELIYYDFFGHVNPVTGSTLGVRASEFDYAFLVVGENLAAGQRSAQQAFDDWMNSPGHRQNILDPRFTELGLAIRAGGRHNVYWVQEFGRPANVDQTTGFAAR